MSMPEGSFNSENNNGGNDYRQDIPHAPNAGRPYNNNSGVYGQYGNNPYSQNNYSQNVNYTGRGTNQYGHYAAGSTPEQPQQEYNWNFEDYEAVGRSGRKPPKRGANGIAVIGALLCTILLVGVVCLSGYGIYSLVVDRESYGDTSDAVDQEQPADTVPSQGLTIMEPPASGGTSSLTGALTTVEIAKKVRSSVVSILQYSGMNTFSPSGEGSGIIINSDGYIVTNAHVVSGAVGINVELDNGETYSAKLVGVDSKTDLAVIKIEAENLIPAEFGDSDALQVGERVIAIGNPGGVTLAGSVTQGIVSAVNRTIKDNSYSSTFIQTDAAINPGNSGGALVNEYGQVIGINSAKIAATEYEGIGFAIPISEAKPVIDDLMEYGYVRGRCKLGITGEVVNETLSHINSIPQGIYIWSIDAKSDLAGKNVTKGDILTAIDGEKVYDFSDISEILKRHSPGDTVTLTLYRSAVGSSMVGQTFTVSIVLMEDSDSANAVPR